jgi:hypothetical protein
LDEDEIDRLLRELGLEVPDVEADRDADQPLLDDPDELGEWN